MKNILYIITILFTLQVSISSCNMFNGNYLGNNYFYLPKYESIDVGYSNGGIIYKLSEEYIYNDIKIHENVLKVNHDNNFIVALRDTNNSPQKDTNSLCYYIVKKKRDSVYGPLNRETYNKARVLLNVPPDLQLKE